MDIHVEVPGRLEPKNKEKCEGKENWGREGKREGTPNGPQKETDGN